MLPACFLHARVRLLTAQMSMGLEPEAGHSPVHPSITKLHRLAQLRVGENYDAEMCQFPPGFGGLSALTSLTLCKVRNMLSQTFLASVFITRLL